MPNPEFEDLPEQSDDDLRAQAGAINQAANASTPIRAHLDRRCGNSAKPFNSSNFTEEYRQHMPGFIRLRAAAMALASGR